MMWHIKVQTFKRQDKGNPLLQNPQPCRQLVETADNKQLISLGVNPSHANSSLQLPRCLPDICSMSLGFY